MNHKITKLSDTRYKVETGRLTLYIKCVESPTQDDYIMNTTYKAGVYKVDDGEDVKTVQADSVEDAVQAYMYSKSSNKATGSGGITVSGVVNPSRFVNATPVKSSWPPTPMTQPVSQNYPSSSGPMYSDPSDPSP